MLKHATTRIIICLLGAALFVFVIFLFFHGYCWVPGDGVRKACHQVSETLSPWVGIAIALVLGVFGAIVARRQTKISYHAVRLDLYQRRYRVFDETRKFIEYLLHSHIGKKADLTKVGEFQLAMLEAGFLFDPDVKERLNQFRESAFNLEFFENSIISDSTVDEDRMVASEKKLGLIKWLLAEQKNLSELFMPYLHFSKDDLG